MTAGGGDEDVFFSLPPSARSSGRLSSQELYHRWFALACYVSVACIWLVPDLRIERALSAEEE